jgi:hypothetical protein
MVFRWREDLSPTGSCYERASINDGFGLFGFQEHALNRGAGTVQQGSATVVAGAVKERTFRTSRCDRERFAMKLPVFDPGGKLNQVIAHRRRGVAVVEESRI